MKNKELSIFIDELGDFGRYDSKSPYYIAVLVLHNQANDIDDEIVKLDKFLEEIGYKDIMIHSGPIIRQENIFRNIDLSTRKKLFNRFVAFTKKLDIKYVPLILDKKNIKDVTEMSGKLSKLLFNFIKNNSEYFVGWNSIKVYYDNGQVELSKIISSAFNILLNDVIFKKVLPKDYKLFQVADLFCIVENLKIKIAYNNLSKSEHITLGSEKEIRKNIINKLKDKLLI